MEGLGDCLFSWGQCFKDEFCDKCVISVAYILYILNYTVNYSASQKYQIKADLKLLGLKNKRLAIRSWKCQCHIYVLGTKKLKFRRFLTMISQT